MMDDEPEDIISHELGCRPVKIGAGPVCASARDRLFWLNFPMDKHTGEQLAKGPRRDELTLQQDPEKLNFWDEGWGPTSSFKQSMPTVQGWNAWTKQPPDPRGIKVRSEEAKQRWKDDKWSTAITFYEDWSLAQEKVPTKKDSQNKPIYSRRHVSPTETERLLGFPTDWTNPAAASTDDQSHATSTDDHTVANQRRNAVGNAFAVPVIRRILQALMVAHWSTSSQGMGMWQDKELAAPYHPDILDDICPLAQKIAEEFQDLTEEFDLFLPKEWSRKLVGAEPGAGGRKNRSERAAAVGIQQGTHLSRNGLEMLIPIGLTSPIDHVDLASKAEHPFTKPVNIPLDLQFAAQKSAGDPRVTDASRWKKMQRLAALAEKAKPLDEAIRSRMSDSVKIAAASLNLGLLTILTFIA